MYFTEPSGKLFIVNKEGMENARKSAVGRRSYVAGSHPIYSHQLGLGMGLSVYGLHPWISLLCDLFLVLVPHRVLGQLLSQIFELRQSR